MTRSRFVVGAAIAALWSFSGAPAAFAHCDTLDGPVVAAARQALEQNNPNLVLIWVSKDNEKDIKTAFDKALAVRKLNPAAEEIADMYFFETLVRIHRAGEGAPYTGLKPAGTDLGPAVPAADKAVATGDVAPVAKLLTETMQTGLSEQYRQVQARKSYDRDDVAAGRDYVEAYFSYIHYVEGVYDAAKADARGHYEARAVANEPSATGCTSE